MKDLIIVESPTKAKTIKNFLGKKYDVIASKGHIRDLPKTRFGIKIEDDKFIPDYVVSKDHSEILKEIKKLAKSANNIYLATDEDREGEAIAYHIAIALGKDPLILPRIAFHEITKSAIENALKNPRKVNLLSVDAQIARRLLDRIVGYKLSPLLGQKIQRGLSAGRVQSSALRLIVDKEIEIKNFKPIKYYQFKTLFKDNLEAELIKFKNEKLEKLSINTKKLADEILDLINSQEFEISNIESKESKALPKAPFMTSTLQQSASNNLNFSPKKTMMIAQSLYEGVKTPDGVSGVITYMRTDSLNIAKEALDSTREFISKNFDSSYLPKTPNIYTSKSKNAQEAHEAIRPTNINYTPEIAKQYISGDELKLYTLIYNRFLASQMSPSISKLSKVLINSKDLEFKLSGKKVIFDGFYKVYGEIDKDRILPDLKVSDKMVIQDAKFDEKFTEPPSRYSEAGLIKKLESLGIGRPSTYAPIITLLTSRNYIKTEKKQLIPNDIAFSVIDVLKEYFKNIVDSDFTSKMEEKLDFIAEDKIDYQKMLREFYDPFIKQIEFGKENIKSQKINESIGELCPECGKDLMKKSSRFGEFIGCSGFPACKYTRKIEKKLNTTTNIGVKCPKCGGDIVERFSRRGKFYGCANYPKCDFTSKYEPTSEICPECKKTNLVIKELKKGTFFYCPECKYQRDKDE